MSFSFDVKQELNKNSKLVDKEVVKYELIGYLISNNTTCDNKNIYYSTVNEYNINRFNKLISNMEILNFKIDIKGKNYIITLPKIEDIKEIEYVENKVEVSMAFENEIKEKMDEYLNYRKEKQPIEYPSAGSTFKRGEDFITAKLIDECGLKGYNIGDAEVSTKHAGFVVNKGNAKAKDILNLVKYISEKVYEKSGKKIELEVQVIGED